MFITNVSGSVAINGGTIENCDDDGIDIRGSSNVTLSGVRLQNNGVNALPGSGHGVQAIDLRGTNSFTGCTFTQFTGGRDGVHMINSNTNGTLTVSSSTFSSSPTGNDGLFVEGRGTSTLTVTVSATGGGCLFDGLYGDAIQINSGSAPADTASATVTISGSTFSNAAPTGNGGIHLRALGHGRLTHTVSNNLLTDVCKPLFAAGVIDLIGDDSAQLVGTTSGNVIERSSRIGINVVADDSVSALDITLDNNTINDLQREGVRVDVRADSLSGGGTGNLRIVNNNIGQTTVVGHGDALFGGASSSDEEAIELRVRDTAKTVGLLIKDNNVRNDGDFNSDETVDIDCEDNALLNARITGNTFTNLNTSSRSFDIETEDTGSQICLGFDGNTLDAPAVFTETAGTFNLEQLSTIAARNTFNHGFATSGGIADVSAGTCLTPAP